LHALGLVRGSPDGDGVVLLQKQENLDPVGRVLQPTHRAEEIPDDFGLVVGRNQNRVAGQLMVGYPTGFLLGDRDGPVGQALPEDQHPVHHGRHVGQRAHPEQRDGGPHRRQNAESDGQREQNPQHHALPARHRHGGGTQRVLLA
jgi:hypothetical protein